ncbi:MAG: CDP-2,3-bis-(O-geranylgeranyl)-sn-glycerol synthase [Methanobrevibacter sp.]|uniref:CDP-2,3-bis-(O-geranylgeranyl)-sn-glycerol synthase n=1 Tax=Methanobrevibacter sp. TaxID=66852 RepID=UPI0026E07014|nr:CDP-2,3-bis-(O-geranylgeranyl)-sn-glycerol synthase [Methanobrevibacter sp.]MDO5848295.1 CDP-2,3-bis-(O-geranylgeranyl)-sn-glycerol synthase [Methanobrevibacter sp.]
MLTNFEILLFSCLTTVFFILPAYASNSGGLLFGGGTPVDFRKSDKKGNRWIGDGVTWKGLIGGTIFGTVVGAIQGFFGPFIMANFGSYIFTPICTSLVEGIIVGFLLGLGALVGDAIGSFLKRRIGIGRGKPAPILDQADFILVALLFVSVIVKFDWMFVVIAIVITIFIHLISNSLAYLFGIKDVWY